MYHCGDGDRYEGEWQNDKRHGKGKMTYAGDDGTMKEQYEGDWCV